MYISPGFGVPYTKQMVSNSQGNFQCGYLLISGTIQDLLPGIQCRPLRGTANPGVRSGVQPYNVLEGY